MGYTIVCIPKKNGRVHICRNYKVTVNGSLDVTSILCLIQMTSLQHQQEESISQFWTFPMPTISTSGRRSWLQSIHTKDYFNNIHAYLLTSHQRLLCSRGSCILCYMEFQTPCAIWMIYRKLPSKRPLPCKCPAPLFTYAVSAHARSKHPPS